MSKQDVAERKKYRSAPVSAPVRRWIDQRFYFLTTEHCPHNQTTARVRAGYEHLAEPIGYGFKRDLLRSIEHSNQIEIDAYLHNQAEAKREAKERKQMGLGPHDQTLLIWDYVCDRCGTEGVKGLCSACEGEQAQRDQEREEMKQVLSNLYGE